MPSTRLSPPSNRCKAPNPDRTHPLLRSTVPDTGWTERLPSLASCEWGDGAGLFCPGSSVAADVCGFAQHGGESREIVRAWARHRL